MKIWNIIKDDFEPKQNVNEGWKENVLATVISVASLFNGIKAQSPQQPNKQAISINKQTNKDTLKMDFGRLFGSGKYIFSEKDDDQLKTQLRELGKEVIKNQTSDFLIEIVSSESQVPNYDAEPSSPTYNKQLKPQELAQKRSETVTFVLKNFEAQLKASGVFKGNFKFTQSKILLGDVQWPNIDKNTGIKKTKDDPAYTKDQFVTVNVKIIPANTPKSDPYSIYANMGQERYTNGHIVGIAFFATRQSNDSTKSGNKDTGYEDVLFKTVKPNTALYGDKNEKGVYLKTYLIPSDWWNKNAGTNTTLSPEIYNYIINNFEVK